MVQAGVGVDRFFKTLNAFITHLPGLRHASSLHLRGGGTTRIFIKSAKL